MQIVERDHERAVGGDPLEQSPERPLDLLTRSAAPTGADRHRDAVGDQVAAFHVGEPCSESRWDVVADEIAHDRVEREDARALAVGEAAPDGDRRPVGDRARELAREARLADARGPEERDDLRPALGARASERVREQRACGLAVDEGGGADGPGQGM